MLVGEQNRVTVFDTLARWRAPIYEDLCQFLLGLKLSGMQASLQGWWHPQSVLRQYERYFLEEYFRDQSIPWKTIRYFECTLLLERWAAIVFRAKEAKGMRRLAKSTRAMVWGRYMARCVDTMLRDIDRSPRIQYAHESVATLTSEMPTTSES